MYFFYCYNILFGLIINKLNFAPHFKKPPILRTPPKMKKGIFLLFSLLISTICYSQTGKISGTLKFEDGTPVEYASVSLPALGKVAISDEKGYFEFNQIPYGSYDLQATTLEAEKKDLKVVLDKPHATIRVAMRKIDSNEMDEIVVDGTSIKKELEEQGYAVNVIETKNVEMQSIQTNELLDRSAGVRIRQTGGLGSSIQYNINGLTGNSIRIFIDGIPIRNYGPSFSLNSIPPALIERIEIYKGVVPIHLSDDALGGAINVVLKKSASNTLSSSYSYGSFNTHQWNFNGNYREKKSGFTVRGSAFYNYSDNNYKVSGDKVYVTNSMGKIEHIEARRFHNTYKSKGGKIDIGFTDTKWADQFLIGGLYSDMYNEIQHGATMEIVYGNRWAEQNTGMLNLTYNKKGFLTKNLDVSIFSSYSNLTRRVIDTIPYMYNWRGELSDMNGDGKWDEWVSGAEGNRPTVEKSIEKNYTGRANVYYNLNKNNKIGTSFLYSNFTRDQDDPMLTDIERSLIDTRYLEKQVAGVSYENKAFKQRLKTTLFYKYYHQNVRLKDRVRERFSSGVTAYEYSKKTPANGYGLAVSYALFPNKLLVLTSIENAIRLPESNEIFGNSAENIDPSYELKPERSMNANFGLNFGRFRIRKHSLGVNLNFFYRDTKDMVRQAIANQQAESFAFENLGKVLSKGMDAEIHYSYNSRLFLTLNGSSFNARFNQQFDQYGAKFIYYQDRLRNAPFLTANGNIRYQFSNFIQKNARTALYYNLGYVHQFFRDWESLGGRNKDIIPTQTTHDLGIAYTLPNHRITVSFDAKNIFNAQVFDNWALQKPGRAFYVKINFFLL
jgi:outer membrane receptor protein involved in Fe transport